MICTVYWNKGNANTKTEEWIQPPPRCICPQPAPSSAAGNMSVWTPPGLQETQRGWHRCSTEPRAQLPLSDPGTAARGSGNLLGYTAGCLLADWSSRLQSERRRASERRRVPRPCQGQLPAPGAGRWVPEPGWGAAWSAWVSAAPRSQRDWWCHHSAPHWLHSGGLWRTAWKTWNKTEVIHVKVLNFELNKRTVMVFTDACLTISCHMLNSLSILLISKTTSPS